MSLNPKIRNKFSPREAFIAMSADDGRTQQHFKEDVDINNILAKYRKTGIMTHVKRATATYGDLRDLSDYVTDLDKVAKAQQAFEMLPAELRNQFKNSITGFFEFIKDEKNNEQLEKWGIIEKPKDLPPTPMADPAPQATKTGAQKKPKTISEPTSED